MTHGHELKGGQCGWEGECRGVKGGKWDNCNSIFNKIYFKNTNKIKIKSKKKLSKY